MWRTSFTCHSDGLETKGVLHTNDNPSKIQMEPQRAVAGGSTSKSGGNTSKAIPAIILHSHTSDPTLHNVIMPSMPTTPTFTLQLFLNFLLFRFNFWLFLVHFSLLFPNCFFSFRPDGQISSRPVWVTCLIHSHGTISSRVTWVKSHVCESRQMKMSHVPCDFTRYGAAGRMRHLTCESRSPENGVLKCHHWYLICSKAWHFKM